jgi:hypothetical protein
MRDSERVFVTPKLQVFVSLCHCKWIVRIALTMALCVIEWPRTDDSLAEMILDLEDQMHLSTRRELGKGNLLIVLPARGNVPWAPMRDFRASKIPVIGI